MVEPLSSRQVDIEIALVGDQIEVTVRRGGDLPELAYVLELGFAELDALAKRMSSKAGDGRLTTFPRALSTTLWHMLYPATLHNVRKWESQPVLLRLKLGDPALYPIPWELAFVFDDDVTVQVIDADDAPVSRSVVEEPVAVRTPPGSRAGELPRDRSSMVQPLAGLERLESQVDVAMDFSEPPPALPATRGTLYPNLTSTPADAIEPDQIVTFVLRLDPTGPLELAPFAVDFPRDTPAVALRATVSSTSFSRPEGEPWEQTFTVDRRLATTPTEWAFRAKALGDLPAYALTVSFDVGDTPAGAYELRLRRKGAPALLGGPPSGLVRISRTSSGAALVLKITAEGTQYRMRILRRGEMVADAPWSMSTEGFFTRLETANGLPDIMRFGFALYTSLPSEVTDVLDDPALEGLPLLITSSAPVAPFELLRLRPAKLGPYLGVDRPVLRWTDKPSMPDLGTLKVTGAACIRPEYPSPDQLPSAALEQTELMARFPGLTVEHVAMLAQLDALLQKPAIQLLHFAGHADGNPAKLTLQDAKVEPAYFDPGTPLMNGGPFLFLNGCRAATGRTQVPEFQANMLKMLLVANCAGAVAPLTKVESEAARTAARTFYEAVAGGETVGAAVQAVRRLAFVEGAGPKNVASYLSYLAFAPPLLRLSFGAAP